jgi:hypothetical protein
MLGKYRYSIEYMIMEREYLVLIFEIPVQSIRFIYLVKEIYFKLSGESICDRVKLGDSAVVINNGFSIAVLGF